MIHSTSNSAPRPDAIAPAGNNVASKAARAADAPETLDTTASTALHKALAELPEIRAEEVERGRRLVVDPNYPPRAIIENLAKLFVASSDPSNQA